MSKIKIAAEDKIQAVKLYLSGKESRCGIASTFNVSLAAVQQWIRNYQTMGDVAFILKNTRNIPEN